MEWGDVVMNRREGLVVRENIGNLCRGDCSQASRYATSGKCGLVLLLKFDDKTHRTLFTTQSLLGKVFIIDSFYQC